MMKYPPETRQQMVARYRSAGPFFDWQEYDRLLRQAERKKRGVPEPDTLR